MSDENIFTAKIKTSYQEKVPQIDFNEFDKTVRSRRSVRIFSNDLVPDSVIEQALDHGLLAPNSSNLQPWKFIWVKDQAKRSELAEYCFAQNGAKTAPHLIVAVAQTNTWKQHCERMLSELKNMSPDEELPGAVKAYYTKIAPMAYGLIGPFGIFSPFKWLFFNILGLFRVMPREPVFPSDLKTWAVKTTALACENIMLSLRAQGYDSLPMEGFDSCRVKKMLNLSSKEHVVMVIAAGKRSDDGVYGPQFRFSKDQFIVKL